VKVPMPIPYTIRLTRGVGMHSFSWSVGLIVLTTYFFCESKGVINLREWFEVSHPIDQKMGRT
jgi:hypothetical protein